jgi:hypothetical protein
MKSNAALGRVVTAPTNGSAGVIPAVLMYYLVIETTMLVKKKSNNSYGGEIGSIFKKVQPYLQQWVACRNRCIICHSSSGFVRIDMRNPTSFNG